MQVRKALSLVLLASFVVALTASPPTGAAPARVARSARTTSRTTVQRHAALARKKKTKKIGFGSPTNVDPVHTYGEPNVRISTLSSKIQYASGPWGTGTQRSIWNRSTDGGQTFLAMHEAPITSSAQSATQITGPGGGDTEFSIDQGGKLYYADLAALASLKTASWDEAACRPRCPANAMTTGVIANPPQNLNGIDRQWFATWDPTNQEAVRDATGYTGPFPVNYLVYLEALGGTGCTSGNCEDATYSLDGVNYTGATVSYGVGMDGNLVLDQDTGTALEAVGVGSTSTVGVAKLTRDPAAKDDPSLVNAKLIKIADLPAGTNGRALFPAIAMDTARNAYVTWVTRGAQVVAKDDPKSWQIYYSYASAKSDWEKWSKPIQVSSPPARANLMPWITAGTKGRIAVAYYGTSDDATNPSTGNAHQAWDVFVANVVKANTNNPQIQQVKATPHPMHFDSVCLEGTGCIAVQGNRNLADFFQIDHDPVTGAIEVVYNDTSNDITQSIQNGASVPDSAADHKGAAAVALIRQNKGIGLFGTPVKGTKTNGNKVKDIAGDAFWDPIYGAEDATVPELDLRKVSEKFNAKKKTVTFKLKVSSLDDPQGALSATGSQALDYVIRWIGKSGKGDTLKYPIYYAAAESSASGNTFYAGEAVTVDLCSVSGCTPHAIDYPAPPLGGMDVTGKIKQGKTDAKPDTFILTVPIEAFTNVNDPAIVKKGVKMESFSVYAMAAPRTASQPPSNSEAENDIFPVVVDGICCRQAKLGKKGHHR
jgi:hypothetical protein